MSMDNENYTTCLHYELTIEDLQNKIYQLELYIEEITEANEDEVNYLHSEIKRLETELQQQPNNWKGVF